MAWDFTADSEIQAELSKNLGDYADKYDEKVAEMYGKIGEMGTYWIGDDYNQFVTGTDGYKTALADLSNSIRMYSAHFADVSGGTVELADALVEIVNGLVNYTASNPYGVTSGPQGDDPSGGNGDQPAGGGWSSYEEAAAAGHPEIMTEEEFERHRGQGSAAGYDTYQDYLNAMYQQYGTGDPQGAGEPAVEKPNLGDKIGPRYSEDWNDFKSDVSARWANVDGVTSGIWATAATIGEAGNMAVDAVVDSAEVVLDTATYGSNFIFDLGTGRGASNSEEYWSNIGEDYAENWKTFGEYDNFWTGAGNVAVGILRTGADALQTTVNAVDTAADWVLDKASDALDWVGDKLGALGSLIFG